MFESFLGQTCVLAELSQNATKVFPAGLAAGHSPTSDPVDLQSTCLKSTLWGDHHLRGPMTRLLSFLLFLPAINSAAAQVFAGDSLRVREGQGQPWQYGRLLSQDGSTFFLRGHSDTLRLSVANLQRVERWQRNEKKLVLVMASVGMLVATGAYYATPMQEEKKDGGCVITFHNGVQSSVCTTTTVRSRPGNLRAIQGAGALGGTAMGFLGLAIWPGQWRVIISR